MLFGLPWFAIIAIVAIGGGLFLRYREQELKMEAKTRGSSQELNELRQIVHSLKSRVENLEAIATEEKRKSRNADPLSSIEVDDDSDSYNNDNSKSSYKTRN